jgi:hypothetical protein
MLECGDKVAGPQAYISDRDRDTTVRALRFVMESIYVWMGWWIDDDASMNIDLVGAGHCLFCKWG